MYNIKIFLASLVSILYLGSLCAQIPTGTFRTHASYRSASLLELAQNKIYCASNQGLFSYDLSDNSTQIISKLNGLSDAGISALTYIQNQNILVIGYSNGSVDFAGENFIKNNSVIKRAGYPEEKKVINNIIENDLIYLSTGVGVVVMNLNNYNIKESYQQIGPDGQAIEAYQTAFYNDSIFVATDMGILYAPFNEQTNLNDFNNWKLFKDADGIPEKKYAGILSYNSILLAYAADEIFQYDGTWNYFVYQPDEEINRISVSENTLVINLADKIVEYNNGVITELSGNIISPYSSIKIEDQIWVADHEQGLVKIGQNPLVILPNGPYSSSTFSMQSGLDNWLVASGGYDTNGNKCGSKDGFYLFSDQEWENLHPGINSFPEIEDLVSGIYNPKTKKYYFASYGDGILEWDGKENYFIVDDQSSGSTLTRDTNGDLLITDLTMDDNGNYVVLNYDNPNSIHIWNGMDEWDAHSTNNSFGRYPLKVITAGDGDIWVAVDPKRGGGIVVYNPENGISRRLTSSSGNGSLPNNSVYAFIKDGKGRVWVGTEKGIVYFSEPNLVLEQQNGSFYSINASYAILENSFLLQGKKVSDIKIDAGNRMWIASSDGAWLVSENGDELFLQLTDGNSILPSMDVSAVGINNESGEVLLSTDRGMISYRSDATTSEKDFSSVKIFPNPVEPGYSGLVTISGLINDAIVKITDIAGQLVYETQAYGGTAIWNMAETPNVILSTGIYLVYAMDDELNQKFVGKIAIIN